MVRIHNSPLYISALPLCNLCLLGYLLFTVDNVHFLNEEHLLGKTFNKTLTLNRLEVVRADKVNHSYFKQC